MELTIEAKNINDWLKTLANVPNTEDPMFRLVWSDDQQELRKGFVKHYIGNLYIGETEEIGNFPKYTWLRERWVLEQWYPGEVCYTPEIPDSIKGSYEPIYVFEDGKGSILPLNKLVVEYIISRIFLPKSSSAKIKSRIELEMALKQEAIDAYTKDAIDTTALLSQFHAGEAILNPFDRSKQ